MLLTLSEAKDVSDVNAALQVAVVAYTKTQWK
jgi:hypothetical protein